MLLNWNAVKLESGPKLDSKIAASVILYELDFLTSEYSCVESSHPTLKTPACSVSHKKKGHVDEPIFENHSFIL